MLQDMTNQLTDPQSGERTPQVSIGMLVFNGEQYIREALDSLLVQTFPDFELIISDDASTDRTAELARQLGATVMASKPLPDGCRQLDALRAFDYFEIDDVRSVQDRQIDRFTTLLCQTLQVGLGPAVEFHVLQDVGSHLDKTESETIEARGVVSGNEALVFKRRQKTMHRGFRHVDRFGNLGKRTGGIFTGKTEQDIESPVNRTHGL